MKLRELCNRWFGRWVEQENEVSLTAYDTVGNTSMTTTTSPTAARSFATYASTTFTGTSNALMNSQMAQLNNNALMNAYNMGGSLSGGSLSGIGGLTASTTAWRYPTQFDYKWELSNEQLERFMAFIKEEMKSSWTCNRCQREYAPLTPDCEFCNVIDRLEGTEKVAV